MCRSSTTSMHCILQGSKVSGCYRAMGIVFFQNKGFADMCFFDCADPYSAETAAEKKEALDFARQARQLHGAFSP